MNEIPAVIDRRYSAESSIILMMQHHQNDGYESIVTVRVIQVRRLTVHDMWGSVIRYATENPQLEFYAGYSKLVLTLPPMLERSEERRVGKGCSCVWAGVY